MRKNNSLDALMNPVDADGQSPEFEPGATTGCSRTDALWLAEFPVSSTAAKK
jgi:hypothetical protein